MAIWPTGSFPFIENTNQLSISAPVGNIVQSPIDNGFPKARKRFTKGVANVSGLTGDMTEAQLQAFRTWFEGTLLYGAVTFTAPHPTTGETEEFMFRGSSPYREIYVNEDLYRIQLSLYMKQ